MALKQLLLFVAFLALTEGLTFNPCDPTNHKVLNEPHRSTAYEVSYPATPICDRYLETGWYRFTSKAGGAMPNKCPKRFHCGTVVPIWMQGSHPSVTDGVVVRRVCANFNSAGGVKPKCCENSRSIRVLNCGAFYIYQLRPTPSCPMAYCAGDLTPCPQGKWSNTGFPPCKDAYPVMNTRPTLSAPLLRFQSFGFSCKFDFPAKDPDQRFEVTWTFEGQEDPNVPSQILSDPRREALLDGASLKGHINKNIRCKVRSYYQNIGKTNSVSPYVKSNSYYAGIQIMPTKIEMSKKDSVKELTITSTIPIICNYNFKCFLQFSLGMDQTELMSTANACDFYLYHDDWDPQTNQASLNVSLVAKQDIVDFGDKQALVTFEKLHPIGGPYQDVFAGHAPDAIHVEVKRQKGSHCSITGDPHITGHEFGMYHLYLAGDFTVYKVESFDFEIQIRTWPCGNRRVTCICAVGIRDKNDIIRVNQCDQPYGRSTTSPTIRIPYKLSEGTLIKRSRNTRTIAIYLPSGAEIKIMANNWGQNLFITSPGIHAGLAMGICGTNDGNRKNEFTHPDGTVDPICTSNSCFPNRFFESWRLTKDKSLFETTPARVDTAGDTKLFCECHKERKTVTINKCGPRENINGHGNNLCPGCPPLPPIDPDDDDWNKRDAVFVDRDVPDEIPYEEKTMPSVNTNKTWPNAHGVTENQARQMCTQALQASKLWTQRNNVGTLSTSILSECMIDILFGDTTDFVKTVTDQFTTQTQIQMSTDPNNYVTDANGETVMKPELLTDLCSHECDEHGHCGAGGKCICNSGWEGEVCQLNSKTGPQLIKIRSGPLCDIQNRPCKRIFIDATNVEFAETVSCSLQLIDEEENPVGKPIKTQAIVLSAGRLSCDLPETNASFQDYKVSATNNGRVFGNELKIRVYDSFCLKCDGTKCAEEPSACNIKKKCYNDQQVNPINWRLKCDVTKSNTEWTTQAGLPFTPSLSGPTSDLLFICKFTPPYDLKRPFTVIWYLDSEILRQKTITRSRDFLEVSNVPTSGKLSCVIKKNGAFAESKILDYKKT